MNIVCSPSGIVSPFRPGQGIMDIAGAGFEGISLELAMCCSGHELEHFGEEGQKEKEKEVSKMLWTEELRNFLLSRSILRE